MTEWHRLDAEEALKTLSTSPSGLSEDEATRRLTEFGYNEIAEAKRISALEIFIGQFKNVLILILLAAVFVSALIGEVADAIVIFVIVFFAAVLGFVQEYRAEKAIAALKRMAPPMARVLRDDVERDVAARELVPGDVILLRMGDKVPADARLGEAVNLKTDEAALTGESMAVEKNAEPILEDKVQIGDRKNMAYLGTTVAYGRGRGVVVDTGMRSEFGKIAGMLQEVEEARTPLQENLDSMGKTLLKIALAVVAIIVSLGILRGEEVLTMFIWGIALAVAAVPEALPAVVTISLALGVQKMARRNALMRKLPAVETLGSTTIICSDKTGTLTQDKMTVRRMYANGREIEVTGVGYEAKGKFLFEGKPIEPDEHLTLLLRIATLCNDAKFTEREARGDPTEIALLVAAAKGGISQELNAKAPRIDEIPFTSERKRMTTIHALDGERIAYSKGAAEMILDSCSRIYKGGVEKELDARLRAEILQVAMRMAEKALRVMGFAYKRILEGERGVEYGMVFIGLIGMMDPPREEAREAIRRCDEAGIRSVMITGDHKLTAMAVAKELGMLKKGIAMTGEELDRLRAEESGRMVDVEVYARVSPAHKLKIIEALAKKGHVIAMTGDGVNDAPALKKADIGVAMGITGTDVAKEAADMLLLDDNFASIVAAIEEGRAIFGNIKKYLMYLLSANLGEILLMATAVLAGLPLPLIAIQILYVNLATDGLPALALSVDPPEPDIMRRTPRNPRQGVFTRPVIALMGIGGVWSAGVNLSIFVSALNSGRSLLEARTMVFATLVFTEFFKAFNYRSDRLSIFRMGLLTNKWLVAAVAWEITLLMLVIYLPFLQGPFSTYSLGRGDLAMAVLAASTIFPILESAKILYRRNEKISLR